MAKRILIGSMLFLLTVFQSVTSKPASVLERGGHLLLASYTDSNNEIAISIKLLRTSNNLFYIEATYTPPPGYHLYSKDLPPAGKNGQGRPTLLELPLDSRMQSIGHVTESVASEMVNDEPDGPLVYPEGPVTLTLPIKLPLLRGWVNDQISLTYTACSATECKVPTIGKMILVSIPGALSVTP
jgi:hypothetical protein